MAAKKKGTRRAGNPLSRHKTAKPWEPTAQQLEVYNRFIAGESQVELAAACKLSQQTVSHWVQQINTWLVPQFINSVREIRCQHTEHLTYIFREAMKGWERSKEDAVTTVSESGSGSGEDGGSWNKEGTTTRGQVGNPSFLAEARAALREIREMWGADSPKRIDIQGEIRVAGQGRDEARTKWIEAEYRKIEENRGGEPGQ